jgi:hypothetical protein
MTSGAQKRKHVYILRDPRDNAVRYVGCTVNPSMRLSGHKYAPRRSNDARSAWVREILDAGLKPVLEIVERDVLDWAEAERRWISELRSSGAALVNSTDGGPGAPGYVMTEENREKLRQLMLGNRRLVPTQEVRAKMSASAKSAWKNPNRKQAPPRTAEHTQKIANALRGRKASEETRRRLSEARANPSEETRQKLREATLSRPEEQRKAFGQMNKGRTFSEEHRANMAEAARRRWAREREKKNGGQ